MGQKLMILKNAKEKIVSLNETYLPNTHDKNNQLINILLLAIRFDKVGKTMFAIKANLRKIFIQI